MLKVSFVRRRGQRDHVYVTREDGSQLDWVFPTYGDHLPHDLCHLVVEDELGMTEGFWGLIDAGVDVGLVDNEATLLRDGHPLVEHPDADFHGLVEAEAAVATLGSPMAEVTQPDGVGPETVARLQERLAELAARWRDLPDATAIELTFARRP